MNTTDDSAAASDAAARAVSILQTDSADELWESLKADGFNVEIAGSGDRVHVDVQEGSAACPECLVPPTILQGIVKSYLESEGAYDPRLEIQVTVPADPSH